MRRPLSDKRPIGPFAQRGGMKTVLVTTDFTMTNRKERLEEIVDEVGDAAFNSGHVADVREEDHAVDGERGVRVVYDTEINAVFKDNIDEFETMVKGKVNNNLGGVDFGKITVVAADR